MSTVLSIVSIRVEYPELLLPVVCVIQWRRVSPR